MQEYLLNTGTAAGKAAGRLGHGILLAKNLMDSVRYERIGNENVLTLIKSIT